ncbi:MAG: hypothetical protein K2O03_12465 [Lachnospiraceae bacterium]|nr:hypothetical protein [Lachnospiraceae bacterium]
MVKILGLFALAKISRKQINANLAANQQTLTIASAKKVGFFSPGQFIENQSDWGNVRFGHSTMKYSGCEIMAVYNALLDLGNEMTTQSMVRLIGEFERKGAVLCGKWGCTPLSIHQYFLRHGYCVVKTISANPDTINTIGKNSNSVIITAYNDQNDIRKMIHTISVTKDASGNYILHNVYKRTNGQYTAYSGSPPIKNLWEVIGAMSSGQAAAICVIGISKSPFTG